MARIKIPLCQKCPIKNCHGEDDRTECSLYSMVTVAEYQLKAAEIFRLINEKMVNEETAIKIIQLYGAKRQCLFIDMLQGQLSKYSEEIEAAVKRANKELQEMTGNKNAHI